jgi:hypothetical protein
MTKHEIKKLRKQMKELIDCAFDKIEHNPNFSKNDEKAINALVSTVSGLRQLNGLIK